ncbi:polyphosphate kinase 1 [Treponema phagedenis]|uniref:polyphosphate kinase 1 n=1 Tax=Treponema phagedenis TaxID=162 RepID=UPI0011E84C24|nr:polyphosphate kinase 1 [Treponema phagedenis]QEJ95723.1 polyphosphate kinase 1 [Treponema phagedenis]
MYLDRELSWIDFNARVLDEAAQQTVPLLERLRFIGIVSSNFDEFFMVRVAGLKEMIFETAKTDNQSELSYIQELEKIEKKVRLLFDKQEHILHSEILPQLALNGLCYKKPQDCTEAQQEFFTEYFQTTILPSLIIRKADLNTILRAVTNIQLHIAFLVEKKQQGLESNKKTSEIMLVQKPSHLSRFIFLPTKDVTEFVLLDELIQFLGESIFPQYNILAHMIFKVNRAASMTVDETRDEDFIQAMEDVLRRRKNSFLVRMNCTNNSPELLESLQKEFNLLPKEIYASAGPVGLAEFASLADICDFPKLKNSPWAHSISSSLDLQKSLWKQIRKKDILLHVPYHSFDPVLKLISNAATDKQVRSIQMTLYRTSRHSPGIKMLQRAAKKGKRVRVFIELKARFDEEQNIEWVRKLTRSGVTVMYDLPHYKVHAKMLLITRQDKDGERDYLHLSTGNYNSSTAKLYSDISLFTVNKQMTEDAKQIFELLARSPQEKTFKNSTLIIAPLFMKQKLLDLIERERQNALAGKPAYITAKMNSLSHTELIDALYKASIAGVCIRLNVRGICMLVPQVAGLSENIQVVSIIDRYLEHSRIFQFCNNRNTETYLASADWMPRNLERRVELMFPVFDEDNKKEISDILETYFQDNCKAHYMQSDGSWKRAEPQGVVFRAQEELQKKYQQG